MPLRLWLRLRLLRLQPLRRALRVRVELFGAVERLLGAQERGGLEVAPPRVALQVLLDVRCSDEVEPARLRRAAGQVGLHGERDQPLAAEVEGLGLHCGWPCQPRFVDASRLRGLRALHTLA